MDVVVDEVVNVVVDVVEDVVMELVVDVVVNVVVDLVVDVVVVDVVEDVVEDMVVDAEVEVVVVKKSVGAVDAVVIVKFGKLCVVVDEDFEMPASKENRCGFNTITCTSRLLIKPNITRRSLLLSKLV